MSTAEQLQALVDPALHWLRARPGATFVELGRWLATQGVETRGTWALEPLPNVILWAGMSEDYLDFFELIRRRLDFRPLDPMTALLVYSCDGGMLSLPIAKRVPKSGYKEPHWVPVTFDVITDDEPR
jgi:hypothetical protein